MPNLPDDEFVHAKSFKEPCYFKTWGTVAIKVLQHQENVVKPHWEKRAKELYYRNYVSSRVLAQRPTPEGEF